MQVGDLAPLLLALRGMRRLRTAVVDLGWCASVRSVEVKHIIYMLYYTIL